MTRNKEHVEHYNTISKDIKFVSNSVIRLRILKELYEKPSNMKELTCVTDLSYSYVSSILSGLESRNMVWRKSNRFYLETSLKLQIENMIDFAILINLLEEIFNIVEGHLVDMLPNESIMEMHLLHDCVLMESDGINADMIDNLIEINLNEADRARCILPVYSDRLNSTLNNLAERGSYVELEVSENLSDAYEENSNVKYLSTFNGKNGFLLIITDKAMLLGFFREEGIFDKNRILISTGDDSLKWANNAFGYFKKN